MCTKIKRSYFHRKSRNGTTYFKGNDPGDCPPVVRGHLFVLIRHVYICQELERIQLLLQFRRKHVIWTIGMQVAPIVLLLLTGCSDDMITDTIEMGYEWETSLPGTQGLRSQTLSNAFVEADRRDIINSIVIIRNGYLVAEKYFNGYDRNDMHNLLGASSCMLSALVGIALSENFLDSLNQTIMDFFPEYASPETDPRVFDITIRHLLLMCSGIDRESTVYSQIYYTDNWIRSTLEYPLTHDPGEQFRYNVFQTHLLSAIITHVSGMSTLDFANEYLMEPLDISIRYWEQDPQGIYFGGNSLYMLPRDVARFGWLYLNDGRLEGSQIVPVEWVETSISNMTEWEGFTWGEFHDYNYGYLWWTGKLREYDCYLDIGYGGQYIINFPTLNMVIVITAERNVDFSTADQHERFVLDFVANYLLTAVMF